MTHQDLFSVCWQRPLALALLATAATLPVQASIIEADNGDPTAGSFYRSLVFGGVSRDGSGGFSSQDLMMTNYSSNTTPLSGGNSTAINADGTGVQAAGGTAFSGFYAARNYASMQISNAQTQHFYYTVAGQGTTTGVRFFTPEAQAAHARFTWHVSGTASNPGSFATTSSRLDFGATVGNTGNWFDLFSNPSAVNGQTWFGPGTFSFDLPLADLGQAVYLYFWSAAYTQIDSGQAPAGASFTMTADFFSTFVLENVDLVDDNGNELAEWTMEDMATSQVLYDQAGRVAAVDDAPTLPDLPPLPNGVPEPASAALAALALLAAALRRPRALSSA